MSLYHNACRPIWQAWKSSTTIFAIFSKVIIIIIIIKYLYSANILKVQKRFTEVTLKILKTLLKTLSWNQINIRTKTNIVVSKYRNIFLGKVIFWPWAFKTHKANCKKCKNGNFEGRTIWPQKALERRNQLENNFLSPGLLPQCD